jgi:hypothetical protein
VITPEEFTRHLQIASAKVNTWPLWKQNILTDSISPTVPVARDPVNNLEEHEAYSKITGSDIARGYELSLHVDGRDMRFELLKNLPSGGGDYIHNVVGKVIENPENDEVMLQFYGFRSLDEQIELLNGLKEYLKVYPIK